MLRLHFDSFSQDAAKCMQNNKTLFKELLLKLRRMVIPLILVSLPCLATPSKLEVTSTNFDAKTLQASVTLLNTSSSKTVVAYTLQIVGFDASGKPIGNSPTVGWDFLCVQPTCPGTVDQIPPGKSGSAFGLGLPVGTLSVDITAVGAVYSDRTYDGDRSNTRNIFTLRADVAKDMRTVLGWLSSTSSLSPADWQTLLGKVRNLANYSPSMAILANGTSNPLETIKLATGDMNSPVPLPASAPTPAQIADMKAELASEAAFGEISSQAVSQ